MGFVGSRRWDHCREPERHPCATVVGCCRSMSPNVAIKDPTLAFKTEIVGPATRAGGIRTGARSVVNGPFRGTDWVLDLAREGIRMRWGFESSRGGESPEDSPPVALRRTKRQHHLLCAKHLRLQRFQASRGPAQCRAHRLSQGRPGTALQCSPKLSRRVDQWKQGDGFGMLLVSVGRLAAVNPKNKPKAWKKELLHCFYICTFAQICCSALFVDLLSAF